MLLIQNENQKEYVFRIRDFWSAVTHFWGFILSILGMPILLIRAARLGAGTRSLLSLSVFMLSMILLYGASTAYHSIHISAKADMLLKRVDHLSIFLLIAGSYTPVCVMALKNEGGMLLLAVIWAIALTGMIFKIFWVSCPRWLSSVIYVGMGWVCAAYFPSFARIFSREALSWLVAGGIFYSVGAVIYALKLRLLKNPSFGNHEIFHCFVLLGSLCHFIFMYSYLVRLI